MDHLEDYLALQLASIRRDKRFDNMSSKDETTDYHRKLPATAVDVCPTQPHRRSSFTMHLDHTITNDSKKYNSSQIIESIDYTLHCRMENARYCGDGSSSDGSVDNELQSTIETPCVKQKLPIRRFRSETSLRRKSDTPHRRHASLPETRVYNVLRRSDRVLRSQHAIHHSPPRSKCNGSISCCIESANLSLEPIKESEGHPGHSNPSTSAERSDCGLNSKKESGLEREQQDDSASGSSTSPLNTVVARIA